MNAVGVDEQQEQETKVGVLFQEHDLSNGSHQLLTLGAETGVVFVGGDEVKVEVGVRVGCACRVGAAEEQRRNTIVGPHASEEFFKEPALVLADADRNIVQRTSYRPQTVLISGLRRAPGQSVSHGRGADACTRRPPCRRLPFQKVPHDLPLVRLIRNYAAHPAGVRLVAEGVASSQDRWMK